MARLLQLEQFDSPHTSVRQTGSDVSDPTDTSAYKSGYSAGWDGATKAADEDQTKITTEFSQNLQDLGFTFHEAKSHIIHSLSPLLMALVEKLLPDLVAQTIGQRVLDEIIPLAEQAAETPIQIVVNPANRKAIEPLLESVTTHPLEMIEDTSLGTGQVFLKSGNLEKHIDLEDAILKITEAITAIDVENQKGIAHV